MKKTGNLLPLKHGKCSRYRKYEKQEVFHLSKSQKSGISVPQTQEMFEAGRFEDKKFSVF